MEKQNPLIKVAVLIVALAVGALVVIAVFNTSKPAAKTSPVGAAASPPADSAATSPPAPALAQAGGTPVASPSRPGDEKTAATAPALGTTPATASGIAPGSAAPTTPAAFGELNGLHAVSEADARIASLGSLDPKSGFKLRLDLSAHGASVLYIRLADYHTEAARASPPLLLQQLLPDGVGTYLFPFAARFVDVGPNHERVDLATVNWQLRYPTVYSTLLKEVNAAAPVGPFDHAVYAATIFDDHNRPVLEVVRTFHLAKGTYDITCDQELVNHTGQPLLITWEQNIEGDLPVDLSSYVGDVRKVVTGYYDPAYDPSRQFIYTEHADPFRATVLDNRDKNKNTDPLWPNPSVPPKAELAWIAVRDRYFSVVAHPPIDPKTGAMDPWFSPTSSGQWNALDLQVVGQKNADPEFDTRQVVLTLGTKPLEVPADHALRLDFGIYAGPLLPELLASKAYAPMSLGGLVIYQMGSCAFCTFQPLAKGLLWFLKVIHYLTFDWGVSIIILVITVRGLLHPITRRSQINMMKMGKMQQQLAPELERLKKKYKDDQPAYQREMMALYKEKGVNPANLLGCLPMFLQMPIWVALYAMLFYAIELRHQPAFYGVFQAISGGKWQFLADLSGEDKFYCILNHPAHPLKAIPVIGSFLGRLNLANLNILPILMGVVYFLQQKLTMPTTTANEQSAQQQAMMKWMTTLVFPLLLYNAPSGLNLYILASTGAGIVDSYVVRQHIKREEEQGGASGGNSGGGGGPKPGGLVSRIQQALLERQAQIQEAASRRAGGSDPSQRGK